VHSKLNRRYQVLLAAAWCARCDDTVRDTDAEAEDADRVHADRTGHAVRVTQSRLIIIGPQQPEVARG
jgi:hypothetical protein